MEIKDILLFARAGDDSTSLCGTAARLAREHGAQVMGLCLCPEPMTSVADGYAIGPAAVSDVLDHRDRDIRNQTKASHACYARTVVEAGLSAGWAVCEPDEQPQRSVLRARTFDLVILRRPDSHDHPARELAEALVLAGGTPNLLVPDDSNAGPIDRIVIAWNGSAQAKRALDDALPFLKRASAVIVVIIEGHGTRVDDAASEALLRRLARHGIDADLQRILGSRRDAGEVLLERCGAFAADLLVMGAYSHSHGAEAILGGATRTVLTHASIPVLMSR